MLIYFLRAKPRLASLLSKLPSKHEQKQVPKVTVDLFRVPEYALLVLHIHLHVHMRPCGSLFSFVAIGFNIFIIKPPY